MKSYWFLGLILINFSGCFKSDIDIGPQPVEYTCKWNGVDTLKYLNYLACPDEYSALSGSPIVPTLSNVSTVKCIYEISSKKTYFVSSGKYYLHFDFCKDVLGYKKTHELFNDEQYSTSPERLYYLANINYYKSSGIYAMEFFADDRITLDGVKTIFNAVRDSCFFGKDLKFLTGSSRFKELLANASDIPKISEDELYGKQEYQALNAQEAYGWLKKIDVSDVGSTYFGRHDIIIVNGLPLDIPVLAGIITTEFQTPLSHVNVLSHNRGTPNMALKTAWNDPGLNKLTGKLVHLNVTLDSFTIEETTEDKAAAFWNSREHKDSTALACKDDTMGLFDMQTLSHESISFVGAKAANLAELAKINLETESLPVPEAAFAIPFYYYRKHMRDHGLDKYLEWMLQDSLFKTDQKRKDFLLGTLRDSIENVSLDTAFSAMVERKIRNVGNYTDMRFRSSTNVEDIEGFNGAGLYESHSADLNDRKKSVEKAIKKVYASLWTYRGFEEREYFKIDQQSAAMGILVHRAFPDEGASGVAITRNIYYTNLPAYTINVQTGGISIVSPPRGVIADQFLFHTFNEDAYENPAIEYITHSNINNGVPVMTNDEIILLAKWLTAIKEHFYIMNHLVDYYSFAMDVEFKLDGANRKLYIKQARPY